VLDVDLGPALVFVLVVSIALPATFAVAATAALARFVRNATRRLAIGLYVMLVCMLLGPAPLVWGDDHLGFTSSQAFEGYAALSWIVGAITTLDSFAGVLASGRRHALGLAFGIVLSTALVSGWVLVGSSPALGLALVPALGTLQVLLAVAWLANRRTPVASPAGFRPAAIAAATCACAMAAYVYLRGPRVLGSAASAMDLGMVAVLAWLPVVVLGRLRTLKPRTPVPPTKVDECAR
jgi:hypothetical protein